MPKMQRLTKKERGFVNDYIKTGNGVEAALANYDTKDYSTAGNIASENLKKPKIELAIKSIAERISDEELLRVHKAGLKASKEVWKNNNETGEIEKVSEEPDYAVRHKYLDSAYKLKRLYGDEEKPKEKGTNVYNFFFSKEIQDDVHLLEEKIKSKLVQKNVQES